MQGKPKKSMLHSIVAGDYLCSDTDRDVIEHYKKIHPLPGKERIVLIDDVKVLRKHMECLFEPDEYLGDEVIDAYINLLKAQDGLKVKPGGSVFLEHSTITSFIKYEEGDKSFILNKAIEHAAIAASMKEEGGDNNGLEANYIESSTFESHWFTRKVLDYLDHDMLVLAGGANEEQEGEQSQGACWFDEEAWKMVGPLENFSRLKGHLLHILKGLGKTCQ